MGIDAIIEVETTDGNPPNSLMPHGFFVREEKLLDGSYEIEVGSNGRFYAEEYARGDWPALCAALMYLLSAENVSKVWYYGDCNWKEEVKPITIEDVLRLSEFFMKNGNRPYYK